ncbi:MAG: hypothetical protein M3N82_11775, partial [Pseudomonadota bacterium]|nr:hypothetical protein [Pseudomonadota bacterium]
MQSDFSNHKALLASLFSAVFLAACGGGGTSNDGAQTPTDSASSGATGKSVLADGSTDVAPLGVSSSGSSATIPQSPLLVGSSTVQNGVDTNPNGMAEAFVFTAAASGTSTALNLYLDKSNTAKVVTVGVYADAGGTPGALLSTGSTSVAIAGAWNAIAVPAVKVVAGTKYWIAVLTPLGAAGSVKVRDLVSGGAGTVASAQGTLKAMPASWSAGQQYANSPLSAYLALGQLSTAPPP